MDKLKDKKSISEVDLKDGHKRADSNLLSEQEFYEQVMEFVVVNNRPLVSSIQRQFRISYKPAAEIMDRLEKDRVVGPQNDEGKREINIH